MFILILYFLSYFSFCFYFPFLVSSWKRFYGGTSFFYIHSLFHGILISKNSVIKEFCFISPVKLETSTNNIIEWWCSSQLIPFQICLYSSEAINRWELICETSKINYIKLDEILHSFPWSKSSSRNFR